MQVIGDVVFARSLLDSAGIEYLLGDENISSMSLWASGLVGGVKLFVKEEDAEVAEEILSRGLEK